METSFVKDVSPHHSTLSRPDKAIVKRNIIRTNQNRNSQVIDSVDFKKKSKNQPKGYCFWALMFAISIIAIANFFLTITVFSVLSLTKSMKSVEVLPAANLIKFFGNFELDNIIKSDGIISGFSESPIVITSQGSDINLTVNNSLDLPSSPVLNIGQESVEFYNLESFDVYEPKKKSKKSAFSTTFPNFELPKGVESLYIQKASVSRITSGLDVPLSFDGSSNSSVQLRGNEGLHLQGKEILLRADQNLSLRSINGSIILNAVDGVFLDVDKLAVAPSKHKLNVEDTYQKPIIQYKLCICMPKGVLFRIPVLEGTNTFHCGSVDLTEENPCI